MRLLTKYLIICVLACVFSWQTNAQVNFEIKGKILNAVNREPIKNAVVSARLSQRSELTNEEGSFTIVLTEKKDVLFISASGFFSEEVATSKDDFEIYLQPDNTPLYQNYVKRFAEKTANTNKITASSTIDKTNLSNAHSSLEESMKGLVPGLYIKSKSGTPGEGAFMSMHGTRSFHGSNMPMILIDGMVYIPDERASMAISGYSKSILLPFNISEVDNISLLKGSDATSYGSLGSAGILAINSERATSLDNKVQFHTEAGLAWFDKRLPLMKGTAFKNYLGDIADVPYPDQNELIERFPFLKDDPAYHYGYLYNNEVDWQEEVFSPAISSRHALQIKGGDAIANYALSVGYMSNEGIVEGTKLEKYFAKINADIKITRKLGMFASVYFNTDNSKLQEQGIQNATNPILAALSQGPNFGIYEKNTLGDELPIFAGLANNETYIGISNPSALIADVDISNDAHDFIVSTGLNYDINQNWSLHGLGGLAFNSMRENVFIPGKSTESIAPLMDGQALNTVRSSNGQRNSLYGNLYIKHQKGFGTSHQLSAKVGGQVLSLDAEYDMAMGINTSTDFYKVLNNTQKGVGRSITGYNTKWNWMNLYGNVNYNYKHLVYINGGIAADGASSAGNNTDKLILYPSVSGAFKINRLDGFGLSDFFKDLSVRTEYALTGNSRYSSSLSQYTYYTQNYRDVTGLVRTGLPNSGLEPEQNATWTMGLDIATKRDILNLSVDYYNTKTSNMILQRSVSSAYGFGYRYENGGSMMTSGIDINLQARLINTNNFRWMLGGTLSFMESEITSLGGVDQIITEFSDGSMVINKVGEAPNAYYGYEMKKVIYSEEESQSVNLMAHNGSYFGAGDVMFADNKKDNIIDDEDRAILGNATPDFFGSLYTSVKYKNLSLFVNVGFEKGSELYNAVRRSTEALSGFSNQSTAAEKRWSFDGHQTDMPKASFGDPMGNSRFSSRWIEDGSFVKLKALTISYDLPKAISFVQGGQIYLTGENLLTFSDYLGYDPEFAYSYDRTTSGFDLGKTPVAKSVKLGLKLQF